MGKRDLPDVLPSLDSEETLTGEDEDGTTYRFKGHEIPKKKPAAVQPLKKPASAASSDGPNQTCISDTSFCWEHLEQELLESTASQAALCGATPKQETQRSGAEWFEKVSLDGIGI